MQPRFKKALQPSVLSYWYQGGHPLPEHTDDKQLADEFADFFMGKIKTIHDSLADHLSYNPHGLARASLNQFTSVSPKDMICIICRMPPRVVKVM